MSVNRVDSSTKLYPAAQGAAGSTTILDASPTGKTITNNGGVTVVDAHGGHPYVKGATAFNGSTSCLSMPYGADFNISQASTMWHYEGWLYTASTAGTIFQICSQSGNGYSGVSIILSSQKVAVRGSTTGSSWNIDYISTTTVSLNSWNHLRVINDGSSILMYINGVLSGTFPSVTFVLASSYNYVGAGYGSYYAVANFNGHMCDLRFRLGIGADITSVPTSSVVSDTYTKLLLPMDKYLTPTTFTDYSWAPKAVTNNGAVQALLPPWKKALSFSGSNYLSSPYSTDFDLGSGDFTIDFFMKKTENSQSQSSVYNGSSNQRAWVCGYDPNRLSFLYYTEGTGYTQLYSSVV